VQVKSTNIPLEVENYKCPLTFIVTQWPFKVDAFNLHNASIDLVNSVIIAISWN
jgi:hypothetical protein